MVEIKRREKNEMVVAAQVPYYMQRGVLLFW